jgi:glycerol kinase
MSTAEIIAELPKLSAAELAAVQAKLRELVEPTVAGTQVTAHPALGIWKDRTDLPQDSVQASKVLRERMTRIDAAE